jgi:hypothetical protein
MFDASGHIGWGVYLALLADISHMLDGKLLPARGRWWEADLALWLWGRWQRSSAMDDTPLWEPENGAWKKHRYRLLDTTSTRLTCKAQQGKA